VSYNRRLWNRYAADWDDPVMRSRRWDREYDSLNILGEEWGTPAEVTEIVAEYIHPFVSLESVVGEIGCGGGRVAREVADHVRELHCFDVAPNMLRLAREALRDRGDNVRFGLVDGTTLPVGAQAFDFLYAFDVFVHLDLHTQWKYIHEIARTLKPAGKAFIHTANLATDRGWTKFSQQDQYEVTGFYFVTPEVIRTLISRAGMRVVKESTPGEHNCYVDQDLLVVMEMAV
jgi:ubiquinone/menaquinone biosynthesis C-methylase UbiE